jgi:hypothetical protein
VVPYKETRAKHKVADTTDVFITTTSEASGLTVSDAI